MDQKGIPIVSGHGASCLISSQIVTDLGTVSSPITPLDPSLRTPHTPPGRCSARPSDGESPRGRPWIAPARAARSGTAWQVRLGRGHRCLGGGQRRSTRSQAETNPKNTTCLGLAYLHTLTPVINHPNVGQYGIMECLGNGCFPHIPTTSYVKDLNCHMGTTLCFWLGHVVGTGLSRWLVDISKSLPEAAEAFSWRLLLRNTRHDPRSLSPGVHHPHHHQGGRSDPGCGTLPFSFIVLRLTPSQEDHEVLAW